MPLIKGKSRAAFSSNIKTEMAAGKRDFQQPASVTFDLTNHHVAKYCEDCNQQPSILIGEAVFLRPDGPIPYSLAGGRYLDSQIWGYILSYDPAARRLEVAPKDADGKITVTTPWMLLK